MAKKSMIARDKKREFLIGKFSDIRAKLKSTLLSSNSSDEELSIARVKLQSLPKNSSSVRLQRRCSSCGRPHAVYRRFGLCRICLRQCLMQGYVPGGRKSSW